MSKEKNSSANNKNKQNKNVKATVEKETKDTKNKTQKKEVTTNTTNKNNSKKKTTKEETIKKEVLVEENEVEEDNFDDDEIMYDDEDEIVEDSVETSKDKHKKENKKISENKIDKIEKLAKEKNKSTKHKNKKSSNIPNFLEKNIKIIYGFIGGVLITVLIVIIIWPDRIATLKDGTQNVATIDGHNYTANDLYENMKDHYSVSLLLDQIDTDLLTKMYEEDDTMTEEVNSNAEYYLNMYEQYYGYTQEQFLSENGFETYEDFLEYLRLDYRRNKYLDEYVEKNITDSEIEKYYKENVFGDINCQHILVETSSSDDDGKLSSDDAKALAQEIIDKLNDGTSWEDVQEEYKDQITYEDLGYQAWNANLEDSFMSALKEMDDNSYSDEPVETSYGYHVIYRIDQKDTPELDDVKDDIKEALVSDKEEEDSNLLYKALISLRKDNNLEFTDTVLESKYNAYVKKYN